MEYLDAKTIVSSYFENGWFQTNYNMNIYKGCCHGCIYCDSRSECYQIKDFDIVKAKKDAIAIIHRDLAKKRRKGKIQTGGMSDPYNPLEKELELTRGALKAILNHRFGVSILTKSTLVLRDIDILQEIAKYASVSVSFTITTFDDSLAKQLERNVMCSSERFEAIKILREAGIDAGILFMPILPFINDTKENIEGIVNKAKEVNALWIFAMSQMGVTLRTNQRDYYYQWLDRLFPKLKEKYIQLYGNRYSCEPIHRKELWNYFTKLCYEMNIPYDMVEINKRYYPKNDIEQLQLF